MSLECSSAAPPAVKEWEEYIQIRSLVEKIRKKQKGESNMVFFFFFVFQINAAVQIGIP